MKLIIIPKSELSDSIQASIRSVLNDKSPKKDNLNYASDYLSVDAASEYLRIPTSTLYQYCSARKITFLKRGKQSYFFKSDLDQWMLSDRKYTIKKIQNQSYGNKGGRK